MSSRPMLIQTQFGTGPPSHGAPAHHNSMHLSPSHGHRGHGQRHRANRSLTRSPTGSPGRSAGRRVPHRVPDAPPAVEYNRDLVRRRRSASPSIDDTMPLSSSARYGHPHVEYHDLRDQGAAHMTELDARKRLTTYIAIRLHRRETSDDHDQLGRAVQKSWQNAVHRHVPDMGKDDIMSQIRMLNQEEGGVVERKQQMSECIQTQLEKAYISLDAKERDRQFHYVLAQFDKKVRKVERYELDHDTFIHTRDSDKKHKSGSSKRKHKGSKLFEPSKSSKPSKQKVKETVSVTVYFKREPREHVNCRQLLHELALRDDREEDEEDQEEEYGEEQYDDDDYSERSTPQTPEQTHYRQDLPSRPPFVPPGHSSPLGQPQYAPQAGPAPSYPQQPFGNNVPHGPVPNGPVPNGPMHQGMNGQMPPTQQGMNGQMPPMQPGMNGQMPPMQPGMNGQMPPMQQGMNRQMPPMGGHHQHGQPGPFAHPPPGQAPGFGQRPNMQPQSFSVPPQNGPPPQPPPPPPPPPPPHMVPPHMVPPHMVPSQMGPPGGAPGFPPRGSPPPRQGPPTGPGGRPMGHPGNNTNQHHTQPLYSANGVTGSPRSSTQDSMDREPPWSDDEDSRSTEASSVDPHSPLRKHAPYEPRDFGIPSQPRRSPSRPYIDDDRPSMRKPSHGRSSRSPPPSRGPGESHYEKKRREGVPAPRIVQSTRKHPSAARSRRDNDLSDVEDRFGRLNFGDDRRDRDRQNHERRRSPVHPRDRGGHSRSCTPVRGARGESSYRGRFEQKHARRPDNSRERSRHSGGSRWEGFRRDQPDNYRSRYRDESPGRNDHRRYQGNAYHRR